MGFDKYDIDVLKVMLARLQGERDELLAALRVCVERLEVNAPDADGNVSEWDQAAIEQARAAIAKATQP